MVQPTFLNGMKTRDLIQLQMKGTSNGETANRNSASSRQAEAMSQDDT